MDRKNPVEDDTEFEGLYILRNHPTKEILLGRVCWKGSWGI